MKRLVTRILAGAALALAAAPTLAQESEFGPADAEYTYYWISNKANLPLFVQYDYVGMKRIAEELGVRVVVAGPTDFDLPGFIAAVTCAAFCASPPSSSLLTISYFPPPFSSIYAVNPATASRMLPALMIDIVASLPPSGSISIIFLACETPTCVQFVPI